MGTLQIRRGNSTNFGSVTLLPGEPAYLFDTGILYIGGADGTKVAVNASTGAVSSVAGKTGVVVLAKADVGLGNVENESKTTMFTSPAFTGTPTAPTATAGTNTTQLATTAFVKAAVDAKTTVAKLTTARTISITGPLTGSASFDGSANISIALTGALDVDGGTF